MGKKGLSPVIATVLLISLALIIAIIIFLWARSFVSEKIQKFEQPVEFSCEKINFEAEVFTNTNGGITAAVVNRGNIPIYALEVRQKSFLSASVKGVEQFGKTIGNGESAEVELDVSESDGNQIVLIPVLLGESSEGIKKSYICDEKYSKTVEIS